MAEPAWVLRARRARVRRYRTQQTRRSQFQYTPALARLVRVLMPAWLQFFPRTVLLRVLALADVRPELRAAAGARAALDSISLREVEIWQERLARYRATRIWRLRYHGAYAVRRVSLSSRLAAHLLVVGLVILVVSLSDASAGAGILRLPQTPVAALPSRSDGQVAQWSPSAGADAGVDLPVQPELRRPQEEFEPAFVATHEVAEGEVLGELATRYRVSVEALFWANDLERGGVLAAGQELRIPRISGVPYVIEDGDSLEIIAEKFQVAPQDIVAFKANGVRVDRTLPIGEEIFIPGGTLAYPEDVLARFGDAQGVASMTAVAAGVVRESETNLRLGPGRGYERVGYLDAGYRLKLIGRYGDWVKVDASSSGVGWVRADMIGLSDAALGGLEETTNFPPLPPRWVWPTRGSLSSSFGWRRIPYRSFHDGLDIANAAGTRIYAARTGKVFEAGWCSGFGYCVKIDHGDGVTTIYGHMLKRPPVRAGDTVEAGDLIGYMGSTYDRRGGGYSTGVHLHFTVKINGKAVNPLKFLP
ncbi:MAG TPA: peptidoglycan DD-metalloendopeptidase family protein [Roseiflexaceae bacterium]|nr:peptidoglycan DD-metalloendopeptidase family protein [Roseiflexaceae bacterium]